MKHLRRTLAPLLLSVAAGAHADVYVFVDANGTAHLTNVPSDARYELLIAGDQARAPAPVAPVAAAADAKPAPRGAPRTAFTEAIAEVAAKVGLEKALLHAVVATESNYNARALSSKGAAGLMQLMPQTARRYAVQDSFDPLQNLQGGALYLRDLIAMFSGDLKLALAAYNAGPEAVTSRGNRIPPFRETENYVPKVLGHYVRLRATLF